MTAKRNARSRARKGSRPRKTSPRAASRHFVGRDASPVLDRYPPKDPSLTVRGPPSAPAPTSAPGRISSPSSPPPSLPPPNLPSAPTPSGPPPTPGSLIRLEPAFNLDEFSTLLGETSIRVTVPREDLPEVLRRVTEFMGFGIYVYSVSVRPGPSESLKSFVVELQRVDYSPEKRSWVAFEDRGTSDSPFGPSGTRT